MRDEGWVVVEFDVGGVDCCFGVWCGDYCVELVGECGVDRVFGVRDDGVVMVGVDLVDL